MRTFIYIMLFSLLLPLNLHAFEKGDGKLTFYNYHSKELLEVTYRKGKRYDHSVLEKINHLFRSRSDDKEIVIDPTLIELLDNIQDHFGADCLELISGYRSPELNRQLKESGVNVAEESMHIQGKAADIHTDEATEEAIAEYARSLGVGGVGYYPAWDFVHIDTGEVRKWDLPDRPGRLLMAFRKGDEWQVMTDKDIYFGNQKAKYSVTNITRSKRDFTSKMRLDYYNRGDWYEVSDLKFECKGEKTGAGGVCWQKLVMPDKFGKYRVVVEGPAGHEYFEARSNEFYKKKL